MVGGQTNIYRVFMCKSHILYLHEKIATLLFGLSEVHVLYGTKGGEGGGIGEGNFPLAYVASPAGCYNRKRARSVRRRVGLQNKICYEPALASKQDLPSM